MASKVKERFGYELEFSQSLSKLDQVLCIFESLENLNIIKCNDPIDSSYWAYNRADEWFRSYQLV